MSPYESGPQGSATETMPQSNDSYKYKYARFVARRKLERDIEVASNKMQAIMGQEPSVGIAPKTVSGLASQVMKDDKVTGLIPPRHGHFKMGIVGAGAAGLFTALVLDWINDSIERHMGVGHLKIDYEVLEAAGEERFGGRLYTHRFSKHGTHDYYDVGAMRFPDNAVMDRTFRLFDFLDIKKGALGERTDPHDWPVLVPYYFRDEENVCPSYFNNVKKVGKAWDGKTPDPFDLNKGIATEEQIPTDLTMVDPSDLFKTAISGFLKRVTDMFGSYEANKENTAIWDLLMAADKMSARQFLLSDENPEPIPTGPKYSYNTIEWIETATYGTGWYDQSLTEAVLEVLDFELPEEKAGKQKYWWCVDGGAQKIAETMRKRMKDPSAIRYNTQVVAMDANVKLHKRVTQDMTLSLKDTATGEALEPRSYLTVFNTTTLGAMSRMDLSRAGLLWDTKQAIRCLGYGASCKVAIKFRTPWWRGEPFNITKGGLARTDLPLQVCVYPSYNIDSDLDPLDKPAVLLVSYTWGQTAQRLATLMASKPRHRGHATVLAEDEAELRDVLLRDLAYLHAPHPASKKSFKRTLDLIAGEYVEHHAYDWYHDTHAAGAFAYFGPGQFSQLYPAVTKPNAFGQLYLVGEAASAHHAWVVGALESVVRGLWYMFDTLHQSSKKDPQRPDLHAEGYRPYHWAMELLQSGAVHDGEHVIRRSADEALPFYPLPAEMPEGRNVDYERGSPSGPDAGHGRNMLDHTEEKNGKESNILYGAALVALCLVEYALDEWFIPEDQNSQKPMEPESLEGRGVQG